MTQKKQKKFPINFEVRTKIKEAIKDLPQIPFMIMGGKGVPMAQQMERTQLISGAELLKRDPETKINGTPIDPGVNYIEKGRVVRMQNHEVALRAAYEKFGEAAIVAYCDEVWDFHYSLKTLKEEPKQLITE